MWSAARWSSDTYWNARTLQCIYTNKKQSNCLKSFVCACVFSNLNNILQFYFNNNQDNEWNINILNNLFKVATIYCTRGEHANHYTTNAVHFRSRKALDANMYFKLKCNVTTQTTGHYQYFSSEPEECFEVDKNEDDETDPD